MSLLRQVYMLALQIGVVLFFGLIIVAAAKPDMFNAKSPYTATGPATEAVSGFMPGGLVEGPLGLFSAWPEWVTDDDRENALLTVTAYRNSEFDAFFSGLNALEAEAEAQGESLMGLYGPLLSLLLGQGEGRKLLVGALVALAFFGGLGVNFAIKGVYNTWFNPFYGYDEVQEAVRAIGIKAAVGVAVTLLFFLLFLIGGFVALGYPKLFYGLTEGVVYLGVLFVILWFVSFGAVPGMAADFRPGSGRAEKVVEVAGSRRGYKPRKITHARPKQEDLDIGLMEIGDGRDDD